MLELLIVLVLMGLAGGVALPSIGRTLAASKIDRTAAMISVELQKARSLASRLRRPIAVSIDANNRVIRIRNHGLPAMLHSELWLTPTSEFGVQQLQTTDIHLVIFPNGLAEGPLTLTISEQGRRRAINMTRAGQIRITTP